MLGNHYRLKLTVAATEDRDDSFFVFGLNLLGITAITGILLLLPDTELFRKLAYIGLGLELAQELFT
ncbi:MAG: hypothetical protein V8Q70_08655 [Bacteroides eggerthii]